MNRIKFLFIIASLVLAVALVAQTPSGDLVSVPAPDAPDAKKEVVIPAPTDPPPAGIGAVPPQNGEEQKKGADKKEEKNDAPKELPTAKTTPKDDNWWLPIIYWVGGIALVAGLVWLFVFRKKDGGHDGHQGDHEDHGNHGHGQPAQPPAHLRPQPPPAPPAGGAHHPGIAILILGLGLLAGQSAIAGTFSDMYPKAGVPGQGYNVTIHGDFSDVSQIIFWGSTTGGASKWIGLSLDAPHCNNKQMVGRIEIPADIAPLSALSLRLVNRSGGKTEHTEVFGIGDAKQLATARLARFVTPASSATPTAPTVVNRTVYQTDAATKSKLGNVDDRLTKAEEDIKVLNKWYPDVEDLEKAVAKDPVRFRQLIARYAPASGPATTVNLGPVMERMDKIQKAHDGLAGQVNQVTTRLGVVEDRLGGVERETEQLHQTTAVIGAAVVTRSKPNVCKAYSRLKETMQISANAKAPKGCEVKK